MAREKLSYRENLELLREMFPNKILLNYTEVEKATGRSYGYIKKNIKFNENGTISVCDLARQISL